MSLVPIFSPVAATPATISYIGTASDAGNATTYTFSSQAIGTAGANRQVVVCTAATGTTAGTMTDSSVTVGGTALTQIVSLIPLGTDGYRMAMWAGTVAVGTSVSIVVTWSKTGRECAILTWALYDATVGADATATSTADPPSTTIAIPTNGGAIGCMLNQNSASTVWTNMTENVDGAGVGNILLLSGASDISQQGTTPTITATPNNAGQARRGLILASWAPV
jgi:hypothetical protein